MDYSNYELAEELFKTIKQFYIPQGNGIYKLPDNLSSYAGIISIAYDEAKELRDNLKKEAE